MNAEAKPRRLPSVAFIYSLIIAILLLLFSGAESISGFMTKPFRSDEAVGGFLEIATFTLPFAVAAWFLWIKPKIGAAILVIVGLAITIWMTVGWNRQAMANSMYLVPILLGILPIIIGGTTLVKK